MEIGKLLREAREKKNLSLAEVEQITHIRQRYLQALEEEDFQILPGQVYAIGFIRTYARVLGLDPAPLIEAFKARTDAPLPPLPSKAAAKNENAPRRKITGRWFLENHGWKAALLLLAICMFTVWYFQFREAAPWSQNATGLSSRVEEKESQIPESPPPAEVPHQEGTGSSLPPANARIEIELIASGECWTRVLTDQQEAFTGTLHNGDRYHFAAQQQLYLVLGNAPAVEVIYNGKSLGHLGEGNRVVKKTFTAEAVTTTPQEKGSAE